MQASNCCCAGMASLCKSRKDVGTFRIKIVDQNLAKHNTVLDV